MCEHCGCNTTHEHTHSHDNGHTHAHAHDHDHTHDNEPVQETQVSSTMTVNLQEKILSENDEIAAENREWLSKKGITAINLISAPGTGKTLLLEKTLSMLKSQVNCSVIAGDQRTQRDAERIARTGARVVQIETGDACHLSAAQIQREIPGVVEDNTRILFIENVGNLVCPSAFDLGENFKVGLLSVTEGEDKPIKYPSLFSRAPVSILTKIDLLPHVEFDITQSRRFLRQVHPGMFVFELSAKTGEGMDTWIDYLLQLANE